MNKISRKLMFLVLIAAPLALASCGTEDDGYWYNDYKFSGNNNRPNDVSDEDFFVAMAQTLAGQWRGDMRAYQLDDDGNAIDSIDYNTDIEFKQYNSRSISGTGTQWDYNPADNSLEFERPFTWNIDPQTGNIYLLYTETNSDGTTSNYRMMINYNDLNLDNRTFTGYLWAEDGYEVDDFLFNRYSTRAGSTSTTGVKKLKIVMR